jgi:hypothetical protein
VDDDVERISDGFLNRAKAKVRPDTTIATSDNPRAMVLVKAVSRTLTAFSHGELPCARADPANTRVRPIAITRWRCHEGTRSLRRNRLIMEFSLVFEITKRKRRGGVRASSWESVRETKQEPMNSALVCSRE